MLTWGLLLPSAHRGFFRVGSAVHLIEPLPGGGEEGQHALYEPQHLRQEAGICGVSNTSLDSLLGPRTAAAFRPRVRTPPSCIPVHGPHLPQAPCGCSEVSMLPTLPLARVPGSAQQLQRGLMPCRQASQHSMSRGPERWSVGDWAEVRRAVAGATDRLLIAISQNRPWSHETRYVELYVVTDSTEVLWAGRRVGQVGEGAACRLPAEGLLSSSSRGWAAQKLCAGVCWRW